MDLYNIYDNIITCDDLMIYNDITLPQSLSINYYLQYKDNNETLKNLYNKKLEREDKNLENIYLFIFNRGKQSGGNYFHFHFHYLQRLLGFLNINNENIKLGIPLNMLGFQKFIIHKIIPEDKIIYLDIYKYNYVIKNCYIGDYISSYDIPKSLLEIYTNIGYEYINKNNLTLQNNNNIFIKRNNTSKNAGQNRYVMNKYELEIILDIYNFKYYSFEDYDLENKIINLINLQPKIIIIEIGSGLTNLLFFPKEFLKKIKFIIIDQHNWFLKKSRIYDIILKLELDHKIITCPNKVDNPKDIQNNPFILNIDLLDNMLNDIIN